MRRGHSSFLGPVICWVALRLLQCLWLGWRSSLSSNHFQLPWTGASPSTEPIRFHPLIQKKPFVLSIQGSTTLVTQNFSRLCLACLGHVPKYIWHNPPETSRRKYALNLLPWAVIRTSMDLYEFSTLHDFLRSITNHAKCLLLWARRTLYKLNQCLKNIFLYSVILHASYWLSWRS